MDRITNLRQNCYESLASIKIVAPFPQINAILFSENAFPPELFWFVYKNQQKRSCFQPNKYYPYAVSRITYSFLNRFDSCTTIQKMIPSPDKEMSSINGIANFPHGLFWTTCDHLEKDLFSPTNKYHPSDEKRYSQKLTKWPDFQKCHPFLG